MRILVVEDDASVGRFLRQALTEEGHAVDTTGDGADDYLTKPIALEVLLARRSRTWFSTARPSWQTRRSQTSPGS